MRFCPQCGVPLIAGAKFCVECGCALAAGAAGAGETGTRGAPLNRNTPITTAFVFVFVAITVVGLLAAAWIMLRTPEAVREQVASAPPITAAPDAGASESAAPNSAGAPPQAEAVNPAAGGSQSGELPAGHPKIELPTEARTFIDKIEKEAQSKPKDLAAWDKLGAVSMRAAMFDQTYYGRAEEAYGHVLKQDPDNLEALRGIGDIDYDKQHYDEAIAAYEHYLKKKPDDPEVRTDLGTMYLYTGNADQAIVQYKKAAAAKPGFFQAYYNMGIAYAQENKTTEAAAAFKQAMALAPDDTAKKQVTDLIAKLNGATSVTMAGASTQGSSQAASCRVSGGAGVEKRGVLTWRAEYRGCGIFGRGEEYSGRGVFRRGGAQCRGECGDRQGLPWRDRADGPWYSVRGTEGRFRPVARTAQGQSYDGPLPDGWNAALCEEQVLDRSQSRNRHRQER